MMIDRIEGNAELKKSVRMMLDSRRMTHSLLLVGEEGLGAGFAARCVAADYLYPAGGAPAEALLRGECCRAVGKPGDRDSGRVEIGGRQGVAHRVGYLHVSTVGVAGQRDLCHIPGGRVVVVIV